MVFSIAAVLLNSGKLTWLRCSYLTWGPNTNFVGCPDSVLCSISTPVRVQSRMEPCIQLSCLFSLLTNPGTAPQPFFVLIDLDILKRKQNSYFIGCLSMYICLIWKKSWLDSGWASVTELLQRGCAPSSWHPQARGIGFQVLPGFSTE